MSDQLARPFESIESAQEFMELLEETIEEACRELQEDLRQARTNFEPRRVEAVDLALYKLGQLALHTKKSRRILNDLRSIRRLMITGRVEEFNAAAASAQFTK